jgi:hypothetical protein
LPHYTPYTFCNECSKPHPFPILIFLDEEIAQDQSIANIYDGRELPPALLTLTNNQLQCPTTKVMFTQKDNNQVFLVRTTGGGLPPWLRQ